MQIINNKIYKMKRKNKDISPIYYKNVEEMDKPISELINELRNELSRTRGKLHDIKMSFGWDEWIANYEGGLTCMISAMSNFQDELIKFENKKDLVKSWAKMELNSSYGIPVIPMIYDKNIAYQITEECKKNLNILQDIFKNHKSY